MTNLTISPPGLTITITVPPGMEERVHKIVTDALVDADLFAGLDCEVREQPQLKEWEYSRADDSGAFCGAALFDTRGDTHATVKPHPEPFTRHHQTYAWLWETTAASGSERSIASAQARADRQLRIEGIRPYLEVKAAIVPPCGHFDCVDLMGCRDPTENYTGPESSMAMRTAMPGTEIVMYKVCNIGRSHIDWIFGPPS